MDWLFVVGYILGSVAASLIWHLWVMRGFNRWAEKRAQRKAKAVIGDVHQIGEEGPKDSPHH